jgi:predicted ribonuclease YlaK
VSNDINLRIKCDAIGVEAEAYATENVIEKGNDLYNGFTKVLVDDQIIDRFYSGEDIIISEVSEEKVDLYPNQFIMLVSSSNDKKDCNHSLYGSHKTLKKDP